MTRMLRTRAVHRGDEGAAMLLVLGVTAIISILAVTLGSLSLNNLTNTIRDKQSGSAFATSEAGVAAAIERIRSGLLPLSSLTCLEPASALTPLPASCTGATMSWTSATNPMQVPIDGSAGPCVASQTCYKVWIGAVTPYNPPNTKVGSYRIHSKGVFGNGPAARTVVVDLSVKPDPYPVGVYGDRITGNGGTRILNESLFARDCVSPRKENSSGSGGGTSFVGDDVYWDQPAAAHSTEGISTSNNCGNDGRLHKTLNCDGNLVLKNDQTKDGGPVSSGVCFRTHTRGNGTFYPDALPTEGCTPRADGLCDSTSFTIKDLQRYGYRPRGLSDAQYDALRARAKQTNTYNQPATALAGRLSAALAAGIIQPVVYVDCSATTLCSSGKFDLRAGDFPNEFKQPPDPSNARCAAGAQPVVTFVLEHGNLNFSGGNSEWLDAAFFVPDGQWRGDGGYNVLGTLFANDVSLGGNETFQLDKCFVRDIPSPLLEAKVVGFREDDTRDVT